MAMDLRTGYDFTKEIDRRRAWADFQRDKPSLLIGSPTCAAFSHMQNFSSNLRLWQDKIHE
eukprot:3734184-Karenia_brevis.AAC.1